MSAIIVKNLIKQYKNGVTALDNLNLHVNSGEIFALLGPNGAGKSTLINILTTYIPQTSGEVTMLGNSIKKNSSTIRKQIACVAQRISIDTHLSLEENMIFQAHLYKVNTSIAKKRMNQLIDCFDLEHYLKYPVSSYSGGVKRRLDIAINLMSQPKILFLDEPTVGMDIKSRISMWGMMRKIKTDFNTTIFLTTHYLEEADQLSDEICIMKEGHEIIQAPPDELKEYMHNNRIEITFNNNNNTILCFNMLKKSMCYKSIEKSKNSVIIRSESIDKEFIKINKWLLENNLTFTGINIKQPTLDNIFLRLTQMNEEEVS